MSVKDIHLKGFIKKANKKFHLVGYKPRGGNERFGE
jgi:hypothetical protein